MSRDVKGHDHFFKKSMSRINVACEFFENALPADILQKVYLNTLKALPTSFIDNTLSEGVVDLLYSVDFKGATGYLWVLCEHQSTPDRLITLRMQKYMLRICSDHLKKNPSAKLPLIYSMLLYTGKAKYNTPLSFWELFEEPESAKKFFTKPVQLIDVSKLTEEELKSKAYAGLMLHFLQKIHEKEILPYIKAYKEIIKMISEKDFTYIEDLLKYVLEKGESKRMEKVLLTFQETVTGNKRGKVMTIAEQLKEQGRIAGMQIGIEKGIEKGRQEGIKKVAVNMLTEGVNIKVVARSTGLSIEEIKRLKN